MSAGANNQVVGVMGPSWPPHGHNGIEPLIRFCQRIIDLYPRRGETEEFGALKLPDSLLTKLNIDLHNSVKCVHGSIVRINLATLLPAVLCDIENIYQALIKVNIFDKKRAWPDGQALWKWTGRERGFIRTLHSHALEFSPDRPPTVWLGRVIHQQLDFG